MGVSGRSAQARGWTPLIERRGGIGRTDVVCLQHLQIGRPEEERRIGGPSPPTGPSPTSTPPRSALVLPTSRCRNRLTLVATSNPVGLASHQWHPQQRFERVVTGTDSASTEPRAVR